jgi:hypothetical protein
MNASVLVAAFLLGASAFGQGAVLVVDAAAGPFTAIQPAIDAATDADVVLVKAGTYPGFAVFAKGVTITADLGHVVDVNGTISIAYLAATQTVVVRGLKITALFTPGTFTPPPMLVNDAGAVWFEDCTIIDANLGPTFSGFQGHGVAIDNCASVVFTRCSITGSTGSVAGDGLHCVSSTVSVHDCTVRGPDVWTLVQPIAGGHALTLNGGALFASGATFIGGKGSPGTVLHTPGLPPICHNGGAGGHGIVFSGASPSAHLVACTITPGAGGDAQTQYGCTAGAPGQPTVVNAGSVNALTGSARHYAASGPIRGGQPASLVFQGPAGEAVWVAWWTGPAHVLLPATSGPLLVGGPANLVPIGTMPPVGALSVLVLVPEPPPGLAALTFFSQAGFVTGTSAVLGPPSAVTALHSSIP